ncbi:MAG: S8 family serine peptidase [Bryobacterales bacterium]|nr:S8 family serine peptidase [Bryobacterales bacterium]
MPENIHPMLDSFAVASNDETEAFALRAAPLSRGTRRTVIETRRARVAIQCANAAAIERQVRAVGGETELVTPKDGGSADIVLAEVPLDGIGQLANSDAVYLVTPAVEARPNMDAARPAVWSSGSVDIPSTAGRGAGVVVGVVDTGIDWRHPDFRHADGTTRIHRLLVQDRSSQQEFTSAQINAALAGGALIPGDDDPDGHGHGTHVTSTAAGNGAASQGRLRGIAPEASIIAVRTDFNTNNVRRAVSYVFQQAGTNPAVVNLSLGSHFGPHDGTSDFDQVIERLVGPGRIVVASAGNESGDGIHAGARLPGNSRFVADILLNPGNGGSPASAMIDIWIPAGDQMDLVLRTPDGDLIQTGSAMSNTRWRARVAPVAAMNGDTNVFVTITVMELSSATLHGWSLIFSSRQVTDGRVHAWILNSDMARFTTGASNSHLVGEPATSRGAIAVAAWASKRQWDSQAGQIIKPAIQLGGIAHFSSPGPSRDERNKPEIAAPGQWISAALSSQIQADPTLVDPSGQYRMMQGTSMAAPVVTGAVALLLEKFGPLTPQQVLARLVAGCVSDVHTGVTWNARWGFGKLQLDRIL